MREIKFRAWNPDDRTMHYRVGVDYSSLSRQLVGRENKKSMIAGSRKERDLSYRLMTVNPMDERSRYKLMQYTGLKDQHGVEIYEGDIILVIDAVSREQGVHGVKWVGIGWTRQILFTQVEVIGNIYQNPELLEAEL